MIASPGLRNPGLGLGLGQVYPGLYNPGEAIMWVFPSLHIYTHVWKYPPNRQHWVVNLSTLGRDNPG